MKVSAQAPANIAFVKYWGKYNDALTLPSNSSISMNLAELHTITTIEFSEKYRDDIVEIEFFGQRLKVVTDQKKVRVTQQIDRLRKKAKVTKRARVMLINNFPAESGIGSSASAFAALTVASCAALDLHVDRKELSILTRLGGSGSATRSILDGFVEWKKGTLSKDSYATQLAPASHWDIHDVILVVSSKSKKSSSLEGHKLAKTSPYYKARLAELPRRLVLVRQAIRDKSLSKLGIELEKDALSLHFIAMTSTPPIWYLESSTIEVIKEIYTLRNQGIEAYFTMDAGPNIHIICVAKDSSTIKAYFARKPYIETIFVSGSGKGASIIEKHLF